MCNCEIFYQLNILKFTGKDCGCQGYCDPVEDKCKCNPCSKLVNGKCQGKLYYIHTV